MAERDDRGQGGWPELPDEPGSVPWQRRHRQLLFAALCSLLLLVAGGYMVGSAHRDASSQTPSGADTGSSALPAASSPAAAAPAGVPRAAAAVSAAQAPAAAQTIENASMTTLARPFFLAQESPTLHNPKAIMAPLDQPDTGRDRLQLSCARIYYAAGEGLCLTQSLDGARALIFDDQFHVQHNLFPGGLPSRARVSPDGRYGAYTVFVHGDSYGTSGFSTRTTIIDMHAGKELIDLEDFKVYRDGKLIHAVDFNFWGVTFAQDSNHFYATLGTAGKTYLVSGDMTTASAQVLTENVECPSLSPDNQHIVFKRRMPNTPPGTWRLYVLDLATLNATPLGETRNVDDQAEWLDDDHVLYAPVLPVSQPSEVWEVSIDQNAAPQLFAAGVSSPVVIR